MRKLNFVFLLGLVLISFVSARGLVAPEDNGVTIFQGNLTNISQMQDVNTVGATEGQALTWDSGTATWIAATLSGFAKWIIDPSNGFLSNDSDTIYFDDTLLNDTIDARSTTTADIIAFGYYNSSDFVITDYYLNTNPASYWNDTYATFNKSYADTLYADISVTGDNSSWNESYANTLYAPVNHGDDWNKTYADTLYADISIAGDNSSFNESLTNSLYYSITNPSGFYNSTDFSISDYFTAADVLAFNYYNASDFDIADYFTKLQVLGFGYYNSSDFDINDYATNVKVDSIGNFTEWDKDYNDLINKPTIPVLWDASFNTTFDTRDKDTTYTNGTSISLVGNVFSLIGTFFSGAWADITGKPTLLSNFTDDLGDRGYTSNVNFTNDANYWNDSYATFNKSYADGLYADITEPIASSLGNWSDDKGDYSTTSQADLLYYGIDNPSGFYNATDFSIGDYSTTADIIAFGYYNSSDFVITDYFTKTEVLGFDYYNSTDFSISDYYTSSQIDTFAYYNATDFNIADYFTAAQVLGFNYYNSTDFVISDYYTSSQIDGFNYYNSTDFDIADYLLTANWNATNDSYYTTDNPSSFYNATNFNIDDYYLTTNPASYWNDTYATFNKTYADGLYADISVVTNNESWNETYASTLYEALGSVNESFNQSLTDGLYVNIDGDKMTGTFNISNSITILGNYFTKFMDITGATTFAYILADSSEFRLSAVSNPMNFYYGANGANLGATMNGTNGNWTFTNNISVDYISGDGSLLTNVAGVNSSFNQSLTDDLYYSITNPSSFYNATDFTITDYYTSSQIDGFNYYNSTDFSITDYSTTTAANLLYAPINYGDDWNKTYADGLYADIGVTTTTTLPAENITAGTFGTGNYIMDSNLTVQELVFENDDSHKIVDNSTCVKIYGDSSILEIC